MRGLRKYRIAQRHADLGKIAFADSLTFILLAEAFLYSVLLVFSAICLPCEAYRTFWIDGVQTHASPLDRMTAMLLATAAFFLADIFGRAPDLRRVRPPEPLRALRIALVRSAVPLAQGALLGAMLIACLTHWAFVLPEGRHFAAARATLAVAAPPIRVRLPSREPSQCAELPWFAKAARELFATAPEPRGAAGPPKARAQP